MDTTRHITLDELIGSVSSITNRVNSLFSQQLPLTDDIFRELNIEPPGDAELDGFKTPETSGILDELGARRMLWLSVQLQQLLGSSSVVLPVPKTQGAERGTQDTGHMTRDIGYGAVEARLRAFGFVYERVSHSGKIMYKIDFPEEVILPEIGEGFALLNIDGRGIVLVKAPIPPEKRNIAKRMLGKLQNEGKSITVNIENDYVFVSIRCFSVADLRRMMEYAAAIATEYT